MDKQINERILQIVGKVCLENDLEFGKDIILTIRCSLYKGEELKDNQDGTFDKSFKVKMINIEDIKYIDEVKR